MTVRRRVMKAKQLWVYICVGTLACTFLLYVVPTGKLWRLLFDPPYPPLPWYVDPSHRHPDEVHHVVFIKVHKAASSTVFSTLIRFSISRELNVMFPREGHLLSENSSVMAPVMDHPPSPPFHFDILCNHVVFDQHTIRDLFPPDSVYITILRDPLSQIHSAYHYYKYVWSTNYLLKTKNFLDYLTHADQYEPKDPLLSFTNNRMSIDLGLPPDQIQNSSYIPTFLQDVKRAFDMVLIAERFDESMVLLKRRLRWTMKDIVYVKLNQWNVPRMELSPATEKLFQRHDHFDIALYDYFSKRFDQLVRQEGPDFQDEVAIFKGITVTVAGFCQIYRNDAKLLVPDRRWNKRFIFESSECETISMEDKLLSYNVRYWQENRMPS